MNKLLEKFFTKKPAILSIQQAPTQLPLRVLRAAGEAPSIGKRNQDIVTAITHARQVTIMLARSGFHVLDVIVGGNKPKIIINPSKRCETLNGALVKVTRLSQCEVRTMCANVDGIQVEWTVPNA